MQYSVIVDTFNSEKSLITTLNSVLRQTKRPKEILICDRGSTDKTIQMIEALGKPIRLIDEQVSDIKEARIKSCHQVQTELISFISSGDYWHPRKMEMQLSLMDKNELSFCLMRSPIKQLHSSQISLNTITASKNIAIDILNQNEINFKDNHFKTQCCPFELVEGELSL